MLNGWLIIDKPLGITSAHAVAKVKRILKPKKIGHAGTLDPLASGVLPLALGEATKTVSYMMDAGKAYSFTVTWGEERTTDDCEGEVTARSEKRPTEAEILAILPEFTGQIEQMPPAFSAIKVDGKRAYDLARGGQAVELAARKVQVNSLTVIASVAKQSSFASGQELDRHAAARLAMTETRFICECGKGTYIRSLARDFGRKLGCLGYVSALRRLRVGKFAEKDAISLELLEEMVHKGALSVLPVESALDDIPALDIDSSQARRLQSGQAIPVKLQVSCETVLARCDGKAIALCNAAHGQMKPVRVFNL